MLFTFDCIADPTNRVGDDPERSKLSRGEGDQGSAILDRTWIGFFFGAGKIEEGDELLTLVMVMILILMNMSCIPS